MLIPFLKDENGFNRFFFSHQKNGPVGKNYWCLSFCSSAAKKPEQLSIVVGTSVLTQGNEHEAKAPALGWTFLSGKKDTFLRLKTTIQTNPNEIVLKGKWQTVCISGIFPNLTIRGSGKTNFEMTTTHKKNLSFESNKFIQVPFFPDWGVFIGNAYLDFKGKIGKKKWNGNAFFQKGQSGLPFLPWVWARFYLQNQIILEFFYLKNHWAPQMDEVVIYTAEYQKIIFKCKLRLDPFQKQIFMNGKKWIAFEDLADEQIKIKTIGTFKYQQLFVSCTECDLTLFDLGKVKGHGLIENTAGFLL